MNKKALDSHKFHLETLAVPIYFSLAHLHELIYF